MPFLVFFFIYHRHNYFLDFLLSLIRKLIFLVLFANFETLSLILNALNSNTGRMGAFQKIKSTFEIIGFAKIAKSAEEAKKLGYLNSNDTIE